MDESRRQFEYEWTKTMEHLAEQPDMQTWKNVCWHFWKSSRAAIEIELQKPKQGSLPGDYHIGYDSGAESQYESDVDGIRAAGLRVKETNK